MHLACRGQCARLQFNAVVGLQAKHAHRPSGADCKTMLAFKAVLLLSRQYGGQAIINVVCTMDDMPWTVFNAGITANTPVVVNCKIKIAHKFSRKVLGKSNGQVADRFAVHGKAVAECQRAACKVAAYHRRNAYTACAVVYALNSCFEVIELF